MKYLVTLLIAFHICGAQAENRSMHCATFNSGSKMFRFLVDVDRDRQIVLVDGQYTTEVSVSDFRISFVLADDNESYNFNIYPNGRLVATHALNKTTLLMQCT